MRCNKHTPVLVRMRYDYFSSIFLVGMIHPSPCFSSLLPLGRVASCIKTDREQQHMSVAEDAALTGRAYLLCSSSLQMWLPLTAPTADKSGNIKENRRATQSTYPCFFSSSPPPLLLPHKPPPRTPTSISKQLLLFLVFPEPRAGVSELSRGGWEEGKWHHRNVPAVSRLITSAAACLVSGFPQASCDPALVSAHQDSSPRRGGKEGEKKLTECFSILLSDSIVC